MSQFERIEKIRYNLQEKIEKRYNNTSNNNSNSNTRTKNQRRNIKKELIGNPTKKDQKGFEKLVSDAEKKRTEYKDNLARSKGITGKNPGKRLEKQIDRGAKKQDGVIGKRTPSKAFAQGEPFQPNNNPYTKSGRYPTSGETILNKRYQYQTDIKGSERAAVKSRLADRIKYVQDPKFGDPKKINKFVDDITKNQKLSKAKGTKSTLYKTLKKYIDAKEPTVASKSKAATGKFGIKKGETLKLPMPDGPKKDALVKKNLARFDADIAKKAKIPKGTVIPKGGVFPSSDIKTKKPNPFSAPLEPKELNLQYKADKLKLDYGGRFAQRDGLTDAQRKRKLEKLKRKLNIKNPTITSPVTGGQLPATKANLKKYGFIPSPKVTPKVKPLKTPKFPFKDRRMMVPKNKMMRGVLKTLRKNPKTRNLAALATLATVGTGAAITTSKLLNKGGGGGVLGGGRDKAVAPVSAKYFLDPKKTTYSYKGKELKQQVDGKYKLP